MLLTFTQDNAKNKQRNKQTEKNCFVQQWLHFSFTALQCMSEVFQKWPSISNDTVHVANRVFIVKSCNKSDKISSERSLNHGITCSHANAGTGLRAGTNVFCSISFRNPNPCLLRSELKPVSDAIISTTGMKLHITCIFYMWNIVMYM